MFAGNGRIRGNWTNDEEQIAMTTDRHKFADAITLCNSKTLDVIDPSFIKDLPLFLCYSK